jgi:hypothetical protein
MDVLWFRLSRRHHHQPIDSRFRAAAPRFAPPRARVREAIKACPTPRCAVGDKVPADYITSQAATGRATEASMNNVTMGFSLISVFPLSLRPRAAVAPSIPAKPEPAPVSLRSGWETFTVPARFAEGTAARDASVAVSRVIALAALSLRSPWNTGWRTRPR